MKYCQVLYKRLFKNDEIEKKSICVCFSAQEMGPKPTEETSEEIAPTNPSV